MHTVVDTGSDHLCNVLNCLLSFYRHGVVLDAPGVFGCFLESKGGFVGVLGFLELILLAIFPDLLFELLTSGDLFDDGC